MAKAFETWTVLPHDPLEKLSDNLWRLEGQMPDPTNRRVMTLARLGDGRILMHNAIALEDEFMKEIDAWGEVAGILVPNAFHRQDAKIMAQRYPKAKVYCPGGARSKVEQVVPVAGSYDDAPADGSVKARHLAGMKDREGVVEVQSKDGVTAVFCDTVLNVPPMSGLFGFLLAPTGQPSVPRLVRWMMASDKGALRSDLERLASEDGLRRIIPGHGKMISQDAIGALRTAIGTLG